MVSVIIPVYNNWHLTAQCLQSLADTTHDETIEVLVIDNASTDETVRMCQKFGESLFPENFTYIRQDTNKNYAGANNIAALQAKGEFLFLLNNDTILLDGWLPPLRKAMANDNSLGAIGPLLIHKKENNDFRVQHAGVAISLNNQVTHLYEEIHYKHKLFEKQRFFQVITGAALFISRTTYLSMNGFNENFINGFEDVEFCYRLSQAGFRQTVLPSSVIIHYGSQSVGRNDHNENNSKLCAQLCPQLAFDEAIFFRDDGYCATISPWGLTLEPRVSAQNELALLCQARASNLQQLRQIVLNEPFWSEGAILLAKKLEENGKLEEAFEVLSYASQIQMSPTILIPFFYFLQRHKQTEAQSTIVDVLASFITDETTRLEALHTLRSQLVHVDSDLLAQTDAMIEKNNDFFMKEYKKLLEII